MTAFSLFRARAAAKVAGWGLAVLVVLLLIIRATGTSLSIAVRGWFDGAFGSALGAGQTALDAAPMLLVALGLSPALRAGFFSVGAAGQMLAGATAAAAVALCVAPGLSGWAALPLGAGLAMGAGALWASGAALARTWLGIDVILFTLLTNYVATDGLAWLLRTALRDPAGSGAPQSLPLPGGWQVGVLPLPGRLHDGILLLVPALLLALWWRRTPTAFLIDVSGSRPALARRCGLPAPRAAFLSLGLSGAAAGLAGWMQLVGVTERLQPDLAGDTAFSGVAVAILGRGNPVGMVVAALLFASLTTGADGLEMLTGTTPASIGTVAQGIVLLAAALAMARPGQRGTA